MEEVQLREYFLILKKRIWILALTTIVSLVISTIVSYFILEPEYKTFTTLMIGKPYSTDSQIEYSDILLSQKLVATYGEIAKSKSISNEVIKKLGLDITDKVLRQKVNVIQIPETEIIKIEVSDKDPELATKLTNEISNAFMERIVEIMKIENVQVIDKADVPTNPVKPRHKLNIAVAGMLGVMIGIFLIILLECFDNTLRTIDDVEKNLQLPVIGRIPQSQEKNKNGQGLDKTIISHMSSKSILAEAYRTLRTNIQFTNIDKNIKSIVVTSTGPGEGKSSIVVNLAVAMAQMSKKVLLIDSDLRKPTCHKYFNISNNLGLTSVLCEDKEYKQVIKLTGIEYLDMLTSGFIPPNPSELLGSNKMRILLGKMKKDYDMILLDSPPIGAVTDATVLSMIVDGTIFLCEVGKTPIDAAKRCRDSLKKINANILGVVMNKIPLGKNSYYEHHYYSSYDQQNDKHRK